MNEEYPFWNDIKPDAKLRYLPVKPIPYDPIPEELWEVCERCGRKHDPDPNLWQRMILETEERMAREILEEMDREFLESFFQSEAVKKDLTPRQTFGSVLVSNFYNGWFA